MAAPTLGAQAMTNASAYRRTRTYRGGAHEMADGTVVWDLVNAGAKHTMRLEWRAVTAAQLTDIQTAFATVSSSSATLVDPDGVSYTVTRDPGQPDLEVETVPGSRGTRFDVRMSLREA